MRDAFAAELLAQAQKDARITLLTGDLGFGVFEEYQEAIPSQYINVGVAEQNLVAIATGLALEGRICFTYSIGNFPVLRCIEQIRNDAAYHDADVKVVSIGGGFSYGALGMSHHATEDIAVMRAIPGITGFVPGTIEDVGHALRALLESRGAGYLRLDKSSGHEVETAEPFVPGHWRVMTSGSDVSIVACGGVLAEAQDAASRLASAGVSVRVVNAVQIAPVETSEILRAIGDTALVLTVEEHVIRGGIGGAVGEAISESGTGTKLLRRGVVGGFVSTVGSQAYLRRELGLDGPSLARDLARELRLAPAKGDAL